MTVTTLHLSDGQAFPFPHPADLPMAEARDRIADLIRTGTPITVTARAHSVVINTGCVAWAEVTP